MTKWSDIRRSETPWNWRRTLEHFILTPEKLSNHLNKLIEERKNQMEPKSEEDVLDMDEEAKSDEVLDEIDPEEETDPEPEEVRGCERSN